MGEIEISSIARQVPDQGVKEARYRLHPGHSMELLKLLAKLEENNASHLFTIHQKEGESLKDYIKRFNQVMLEVEGANDKVIVMMMMEGLLPSPLFDSLSRNVPKTQSALQSKADKYIAAEELTTAKRKRRGRDDQKRKELELRQFDYKDKVKSRRTDRDHIRPNDRRPRTPPRQPNLMLPYLNATITQVLIEIKHNKFVKWLVKIKIDPRKRDKSKLPSSKLAKNEIWDNHPTTGNIQVIHGGFECGCLNSSRKRHARNATGELKRKYTIFPRQRLELTSPISFTNDYLRGLHLPHDDALVISTIIANFNVQRILIDNGSLVDILFILAFDKMKIRLDKLHPFHTPQVGFWGNMTHPLGWIKLLVTLGMEPYQTTIWQDFIIVDFPSPYNGNVLGIDPEVAIHKLFTNPNHTPVRQKRRKFAPERLFISKSVDKCSPFFKILRKNLAFQWTDETEMVFQELKEYLGSPPLLTVPTMDEELLVYLSVSSITVGLVLQTPSGDQIEYAICIGFRATNNEVEYKAFLAGLRVVVGLGVESLDAFSDSQLIVIISDNARQLDNDRFKLLCSDLNISHHFFSPGHPQANGQVKVSNRTILRNLKVRLEKSKSKWVEDLPCILWAYHTTSRIPTGKTSFSIVYRTASVIPVEIGLPNFRTSNFDKEHNEIKLRLNLDLIDEKRECAKVCKASYKHQVTQYYNQRVKHKSFLLGDLVLKKVTLATKEVNFEKLAPTWECPYKAIRVSKPGTYWL
ncbi:hypothetical protein Acr_28g0002730 [Actinidia rufa]|uniref:Integrase catalytic domain-containing protein n=1 Tax=Actinidia rufa TaxID=165716 RepID=A0A7J0H980_9ERIC|nr:hypothetical protein Acr_28g0002730 [Actinidia rufa]